MRGARQPRRIPRLVPAAGDRHASVKGRLAHYLVPGERNFCARCPVAPRHPSVGFFTSGPAASATKMLPDGSTVRLCGRPSWPGPTPGPAELVHDLEIAAPEHRDDVRAAVGDVEIRLRRVVREADRKRRFDPARPLRRPRGFLLCAAARPQDLLLHELALLAEHLDAVVGAIRK